MCQGSIEGRSEPRIPSLSIREHSSYLEHNAGRQDHPDSPAQIAPTPANKASVHQIPVTSEQSLHCIERINGDTHLLSLPLLTVWLLMAQIVIL